MSQRAILFDAGDTLLFPKPTRELMFQQIAATIGLKLPIDAIRDGYRHLDLHLARYGRPFPRVGFSPGAAYNALILEGAGFSGDLLVHAESITAAFSEIESFEFQVFSETGDVLNHLVRLGYKLGVVSNWDESLEPICADLGLTRFFDAIVASQVVGFAKPDRRIFEIALQQLNVEKANTFHVGDSYHTDVIGPRNAGITPILFDWKGCYPDVDCLRIETLNELINKSRESKVSAEAI